LSSDVKCLLSMGFSPEEGFVFSFYYIFPQPVKLCPAFPQPPVATFSMRTSGASLVTAEGFVNHLLERDIFL